MCDMEGLGSVSLNRLIVAYISRKKIYQELYHEIFSILQRQMLDDMFGTIRTMRTRASQLMAMIL